MSTPLPPPPPPVPRAQPTGYHEPYHEPYGAVQMTQRRTAATEASSASYYHSEAASTHSTPYTAPVASPMYYATTSPSPVTMPSSSLSPPVSYAYNRVALVFLLPPLLAILYTGRPEEESETSLLLPVLLCTVLVLYSLDLANLRNASLSGTWMAFVILSAINAIDTFRKDDDTGILFWMFQVATATLLLACWVRTNAKCVVVDYRQTQAQSLTHSLSNITGMLVHSSVSVARQRIDTNGTAFAYHFASCFCIGLNKLCFYANVASLGRR